MPEITTAITLLSEPVPVWLVRVPAGEHHSPPFGDYEFLERLGIGWLGLEFRACTFGRLRHILATGVDVDPTDGVMWVDDYFDKAWEYGGWPKLVMALDVESLERSYRAVAAETDPETLAHIRADYPTSLERQDGKMLWFSRLPEDDKRLATQYERLYGRWIGPDGAYPLRALLIFVRPEDEAAVIAALG